VNRLAFVTGLGAVLAAPLTVEAQRPAKIARIGYVSTNLAANPNLREAFRRGLRDLGYEEGRNVAIEFRSAEGRLKRFPALVAELVALKVDVIVEALDELAAFTAARTAGDGGRLAVPSENWSIAISLWSAA
jgi:ABC-type uncharacterized transport system substrate-binding protein